MEHFEYLFAAYSMIFLLIGLYVVFIARRQARLDREVARLEASVRSAEHAATASEAGTQD
jgi:CcmD family protein